MKRLLLLVTLTFVIFTTGNGYCESLDEGDELKKKVDSLFVLACGGLEKYRDQAQPAESTLVEMGEKARGYAVRYFDFDKLVEKTAEIIRSEVKEE